MSDKGLKSDFEFSNLCEINFNGKRQIAVENVVCMPSIYSNVRLIVWGRPSPLKKFFLMI